MRPVREIDLPGVRVGWVTANTDQRVLALSSLSPTINAPIVHVQIDMAPERDSAGRRDRHEETFSLSTRVDGRRSAARHARQRLWVELSKEKALLSTAAAGSHGAKWWTRARRCSHAALLAYGQHVYLAAVQLDARRPEQRAAVHGTVDRLDQRDHWMARRHPHVLRRVRQRLVVAGRLRDEVDCERVRGS